eukprot:10180704-Alexandrium_andersonii.AAC.1
MSASLVGSEMCIRDRVPPSSAHKPRPFMTLQACREPLLFEYRCGLDAVSYTHLTLPTICSV